ncbi:MAG: hypothetical protein EBR07_12885, partial [Planctomycetes bacterium]|nr:hypothetical protein [Planctomycetota bacterium]
MVPWIAVVALIATFVTMLKVWTPEAATAAQLPMPMLGKYIIALLCVVGVGHVLASIGSIDRAVERQVASGTGAFDPVRVIQGEFYAFILLSLCGGMLLCHATDLVWLFLAFELCSLPTYVLVAIGRGADRSMEAAIKYFFLGAMSTATLLLGFAFLYGATGTLELSAMRESFQMQAQTGGIGSVAIVGMLLAVIGICFKLAAVPMHFYAPDVYEGASSPVAAGSTNGIVSPSIGITGLQSAQNYYYRAVASNSFGVSYGSTQAFLTASPPPSVVTGIASYVSTSSASVSGLVNPNGLSTGYWVEYGTNSALGLTTKQTASDDAESYTSFSYGNNGGNGFGPFYGYTTTGGNRG